MSGFSSIMPPANHAKAVVFEIFLFLHCVGRYRYGPERVHGNRT